MTDEPVKLSAYITPTAAEALNRVMEVSGDSGQDTLSFALVFWATLQELVIQPGNELLIRDPRTGQLHEVELSVREPE